VTGRPTGAQTKIVHARSHALRVAGNAPSEIPRRSRKQACCRTRVGHVFCGDGIRFAGVQKSRDLASSEPASAVIIGRFAWCSSRPNPPAIARTTTLGGQQVQRSLAQEADHG
jgi:hypothetical protein